MHTQFAQLTGDAALKEALIRRYDRFLAPMERTGSPCSGMDHTIFGIDAAGTLSCRPRTKVLATGKMLAGSPMKTDAGRLSDQTRFWIDDMMITILVSPGVRATGDSVYPIAPWWMMVVYPRQTATPQWTAVSRAKLFRSSGAGNGWCDGMAEFACFLPEKHPSGPHHGKLSKNDGGIAAVSRCGWHVASVD